MKRSWTKRDIIEGAFEELGLASNLADMLPKHYESARRRLDSLFSEWESRGIRVGYSTSIDPDHSDLDDESMISDQVNTAAILNLSIHLAPSYGKVLNPATISNAKSSLNALLAKSARPVDRKLDLDSVPFGIFQERFYRKTEEKISLAKDDFIEL